MSYDVYFLAREAGQSWEDALDALEHRVRDESLPTGWDDVVRGVGELLGGVEVSAGPPSWCMGHRKTGIEVSCLAGEWSMSVPFWTSGDAALGVVDRLKAIAAVVEAATGLSAYDPQTGELLLGVEDSAAAGVFDRVAESFAERGIRSPGDSG
ncbi:hypothetical protein [Yinghuangia soli]|uniref:Uncharacterized protein n=1 Tax=Yinghuangia soli TaxID=2908204 RepID=A0AA41U1R4_9ACTN|nr:hypothetical protein [Yinghuangia soli]MCF2527837.1 hypothetical protein [Yinghuangia soli]